MQNGYQGSAVAGAVIETNKKRMKDLFTDKSLAFRIKLFNPLSVEVGMDFIDERLRCDLSHC